MNKLIRFQNYAKENSHSYTLTFYISAKWGSLLGEILGEQKELKIKAVLVYTKWQLQQEGRQDGAHPWGAYDGTHVEGNVPYLP